MNSKIQYHKWTEIEYKNLNKSIRDLFGTKSLQFYMPFFSLYFYLHNKSKVTNKFDLKRNYYLKEVTEITKSRYYNSNMFLKGKIYNECKNITIETELFCKSIPIVDPIHCINNNYNFVNHNNYHLPSNYNYNTFHKINDINNTAYIDVFCSYLFGNLTYHKINPSFPLFYGSVNGIGDYNYDLTEDYMDIKNDKCFNENIDKGFQLEIYVSDSDSDSNSDSDTQSKEQDNYDDCIAKIKKIPIQMLFIEKLEKTLEDLIDENISEDVLLTCIFQISFALTYLQKYFNFTHNDLHINNVMFSRTESKYLYYKYNNIYYRVPTHGYIFKIIDFGRAIFKYRNKIFMNDVFSTHGEAGGQYSYPSQINFMIDKNNDKDKETIRPNFNFDLCRLSMTILEEIDPKNYSEGILLFLNKMCKNHLEQSFCDMNDDFYLYKSIARDACNCLPREIIMNNIFKKYRIKKKLFPRKSFYTV